jgi:flagellar biosynthesis/type III secretory pathway M-ring protein FliF/YscJ
MIAALMAAGGVVLGVVVGLVWIAVEKRIQTARAAREKADEDRKQADWEKHVAEAVAHTQEPIFAGRLLDYERGQA